MYDPGFNANSHRQKLLWKEFYSSTEYPTWDSVKKTVVWLDQTDMQEVQIESLLLFDSTISAITQLNNKNIF